MKVLNHEQQLGTGSASDLTASTAARVLVVQRVPSSECAVLHDAQSHSPNSSMRA